MCLGLLIPSCLFLYHLKKRILVLTLYFIIISGILQGTRFTATAPPPGWWTGWINSPLRPLECAARNQRWCTRGRCPLWSLSTWCASQENQSHMAAKRTSHVRRYIYASVALSLSVARVSISQIGDDKKPPQGCRCDGTRVDCSHWGLTVGALSHLNHRNISASFLLVKL